MPGSRERLTLGEGAIFDHQLSAALCASFELDISGSTTTGRVVDQRCRRRPVPVRQTAAGGAQHVPGALDPHRIGAVDPRGVSGSSRASSSSIAPSLARPRPAPSTVPDLEGDRRDVGEAFGQRREVEPGAADDDRAEAERAGFDERSGPRRAARPRRSSGRAGDVAVEAVRRAPRDRRRRVAR